MMILMRSNIRTAMKAYFSWDTVEAWANVSSES